MNLPLAAQPRPLSLGEIITTAWDVFSARPGDLLRIVGVIELPVALATSIIGLFLPTPPLPVAGEEAVTPDAGPLLLGLILALAIALVRLAFSSLSIGAGIRAVGDALAGDQVEFRRSYRVAVNRFSRVFGTLLVLWLVAGFAAGFLASIIGLPIALLLLYFTVRWIVAPVVVVLENTRTRYALARSRTLIRGTWWRTLGIFLVIMILAVLPLFAAQVLSAALTVPASGTVAEAPAFLLAALGVAGGGVIGTTFGIAAITVLYYDLRAREAQRVRTA